MNMIEGRRNIDKRHFSKKKQLVKARDFRGATIQFTKTDRFPLI